jgi:hypothetical protein
MDGLFLAHGTALMAPHELAIDRVREGRALANGAAPGTIGNDHFEPNRFLGNQGI